MSPHLLDCQGLPCPQPVIRLKKILENAAPQSLVVLVDNEAALENVGRFLASQGYEHGNAQEGALWRIQAKRRLPDADGCEIMSDAELRAPAEHGVSTAKTPAEETKTLIMIIAPVFGSGDDLLGAKLMANFVSTLGEMGPSLWRVVLLNGGVRLAAQPGPVLAELQKLEQNGVDILVCGTCLEHFGLLEKKAVGQTTNMLDVVTGMQLADKVIRI